MGRRKLPGDDFNTVAKRLECDEDKARFEKKLGKLAKAKTSARRAKSGITQ